MEILFIIALVLIWPTKGFSFLAWISLFIILERNKNKKIKNREMMKIVIEPLFNGQFSEFFFALDVPIYSGIQITQEEAYKCGRHIMNYIAHNSSETTLFVQGLQKWKTKGSLHLCDPVTAAREEKSINIKGEIHIVSYRAIEALMKNNNLKCFEKIDFARILEYIFIIDLMNARSSLVNENEIPKIINQKAPMLIENLPSDKIIKIEKNEITSLVSLETLFRNNIVLSWVNNASRLDAFVFAIKELASTKGVSKLYFDEYMKNESNCESIFRYIGFLEGQGKTYQDQKKLAAEAIYNDWSKLKDSQKKQYSFSDLFM